MASASARYYYAPPTVLPSLHEMFPEHILNVKGTFPYSQSNFASPQQLPQPRQEPASFSFEVLRSHPGTPSLEHISSTSASLHSGSSDGDADDTATEQDDCGEAYGGKKHACKTCGKCFNRPSSLRIHANTHSGAQPYICPFPSCGRTFNVNSNMRRHYRNHGGAGLPTTARMFASTPPYIPPFSTSKATTPDSTFPSALHSTPATSLVFDARIASGLRTSSMKAPPEPRYGSPFPASHAQISQVGYRSQSRHDSYRSPSPASPRTWTPAPESPFAPAIWEAYRGVGGNRMGYTSSYSESDVRSQH